MVAPESDRLLRRSYQWAGSLIEAMTIPTSRRRGSTAVSASSTRRAQAAGSQAHLDESGSSVGVADMILSASDTYVHLGVIPRFQSLPRSSRYGRTRSSRASVRLRAPMDSISVITLAVSPNSVRKARSRSSRRCPPPAHRRSVCSMSRRWFGSLDERHSSRSESVRAGSPPESRSSNSVPGNRVPPPRGPRRRSARSESWIAIQVVESRAVHVWNRSYLTGERYERPSGVLSTATPLQRAVSAPAYLMPFTVSTTAVPTIVPETSRSMTKSPSMAASSTRWTER